MVVDSVLFKQRSQDIVCKYYCNQPCYYCIVYTHAWVKEGVIILNQLGFTM